MEIGDGREKLQRERELCGSLQDKMIWKTDPDKEGDLSKYTFIQARPKKLTHPTHGRETIASLSNAWTKSRNWQKQNSMAGKEKIPGSIARKTERWRKKYKD